MPMRLRVGNVATSTPVDLEAPPDTTLLAVLRGPLGLKSVVRGCRNGSCGSCRILLNGALVSSCLILLRDVPEGAHIETYEHVATEPSARAAVSHFEEERNSRCRLCVAGLGVAAVHLLRTGGDGDEGAIEAIVQGAHCQCTGRASLRRSLAFVHQKPGFSGTSGS